MFIELSMDIRNSKNKMEQPTDLLIELTEQLKQRKAELEILAVEAINEFRSWPGHSGGIPLDDEEIADGRLQRIVKCSRIEGQLEEMQSILIRIMRLSREKCKA
jgi:hypothetical protein